MVTGWQRRVAEVVRRRRVAADTDDELALHVELLVAERIERGMSEAEARRQVAVAVGRVDAAREQVAEERTGFAVEQLGRELRHAARLLCRAPGLALTSVLTIAVGIGASTALFALVDAVVLRPLPYPDAGRLVRIVDTNTQSGIDRTGVTTGNLHDWRRRATAFSAIAGHYAMGRTLSVGGEAEVVIGAQVTADFFAVAGTAPALGRTFTPEEVAAATFSTAVMPTSPSPVVIIADGLWRSRFGADPAVVGRTILLERRPFTVVGVMPPRFALPDRDVQIWLPWHVDADSPRDQHFVGATARLAPGVALDEAERQLAGVAAELAVEYPETNHGWSVRLLPLAEDTVGTAADALWLLLGAVALLLAVASANVALLTLLRGLDRATDTALRLALGASSARLVREFLMESLLLATAGGLLGAAIAGALLRALPMLAPDLPRVDEVTLDGRVLVFAMAVTTTVALLSGLPPAWRRARLAPASALADSSTRATGGGRRHLFRDGMVVAQVALAVVLLLGSGLLVRSVRALGAVDPGYDPRGVLVVPVFLDSQGYASGERSRTYYRTLFDAMASLPGVVAVGGATTVPTSPLGPDFERPVWPEGTTPAAANRTPASVRVVTPGTFAALGLRVAGGRALDDRDTPTGPLVVMVNESLARRLWPGQSPVGRQLVVDYSTAGTYPYEIVGVVADTRFRGPRSQPQPEIFLAHAQRPYLILNVVVKAAGDPRSLIPAVRSALRQVDPLKPPQGVYQLEDLLGATYVRDRQVMTTMLVFAAAATFLAVLSVYGVLSQRVRERSREIGIRIALGATAAGLVAWVGRAGARLIGLGLVLGLMVAWAASNALDGLLFEVAPTDARTGTTVVAAIWIVGLVATLVPSWRATRIDPVAILRRG